MFCDNCGNQLEEGSEICQNCGTLVSAKSAPQPEGQEPQPETPVDMVKRIVIENKKIIGIAAIAVVVLILIISLFGGGGYKSTVKDFMKAFEKADGKKIVNLTIPKKMQDDYFDELDLDKDDYIDDMEESLEDIWEAFEEEDGKFSWKIQKAESLKKLDELEDEVEGRGYDDIDEYRERMESRYEDYNFNAEKIKDVYAVEIEVITEVDDDEDSNDSLIFVYKYDGKWYVDMSSLYSLY